LRDMGGIIVVDFIDMIDSAHRQQLLEHFTNVMSKDRARHNILPLSKFGIMQITRQHVRPMLEVDTSEKCPTCLGTGKTSPSLLFTDTLEEKIGLLTKKMNIKRFILHVHPYVFAYITKGLTSIKMRWKWKYSNHMKVIPDQSLGLLEYKFCDEEHNEFEVSDNEYKKTNGE